MTPELVVGLLVSDRTAAAIALRGLWRQRREQAIALVTNVGLYALVYVAVPLVAVTARHDDRLALPFGLAVVLIGASVLLASRQHPVEVIAFLSGLAFGGTAWLETAILSKPAGDLTAFLRDHAFDYFSAGAIVGGVSAYLATADRGVRQLSLGGSIAVIAGLTAFTATGDFVSATASVSAGAAAGIVVGWLDPLPQYRDRFKKPNKAESE